MTEEQKKLDVHIKYDGEDPSITQIVSRRFKQETDSCLFICGIIAIIIFIIVVVIFFSVKAAGS